MSQEGIIYILTNEAMPNLVKIGKTKNIEARMKNLYSTGVPAPFKCECAVRAENISDIEQGLHKLLDSVRFNKSREFFQIGPEKVVKILRDLPWEMEDVTPAFQKKMVAEEKEQPRKKEKNAVSNEPVKEKAEHSSLLESKLCDNEHYKILGKSAIDGMGGVFYWKERNEIHHIKRATPITVAFLAPYEFWREIGSERKIAVTLNRAVSRMEVFKGEVRGCGVWRHNQKEIILNTGTHIVKNGRKASFGEMNGVGETLPFDAGNGFYESSAYSIDVDLENPISRDEAKEFLSICQQLRWKNKNLAGSLLAGWIVSSFFTGILQWRPIIWIVGGQGLGKSTVIETIIKKALGSAVVGLLGKTTESGLRTQLSNHAVAVVIDEFERKFGGQGDAMRIDGILQYARLSSTESTSRSINARGQFTTRASFCFASIKPHLRDVANKDRVSVLELSDNGGSKSREKNWAKVNARIDKLMTNDFSARFLSFLYHNAQTYLKNIEVIRGCVSLIGETTKRYADQISPMLAGACLLRNPNRAITEAEFDKIYTASDFEEYESVHTDTDERDGFNKLLSLRVKPEGSNREFSLRKLLMFVTSPKESDELDVDIAKETLNNYGIKYMSQSIVRGERYTGLVYFATNCSARDLLLDKYNLRLAVRVMIERMQHSVKLDTVANFSGHMSRVVAMPLNKVIEIDNGEGSSCSDTIEEDEQ